MSGQTVNADVICDMSVWEAAIKAYLTERHVVNVDGFWNELLQKESSCERVLSLVKGDTIATGNREWNFAGQFRKFCDATVGWTRSWEAVLELTKTNGKRPIGEILASEGTTSTSRTPTDVAFWMNVPRQGSLFNVNTFLILRGQKQGNCYLHSAVTMEHYLVCLSSGLKDMRMLNVGYWQRSLEIANAYDLRNYLSRESGNSREALEQMCGFDYRTESCNNWYLDSQTAPVVYEILKRRPVLLNSMRVFSELRVAGKVSYSKADRVDKLPPSANHSMVIIGARKDTTNPADLGYYFLLQSTWCSKMFLECSLGYMKHCAASVVDVKDGDVNIVRNANIDANLFLTAEYAESALDIPDEGSVTD